MRDNNLPRDNLDSGRKKVLIVDDDAEIVELLGDILAFQLNYPGDVGLFAEKFEMAASMAGTVLDLTLTKEGQEHGAERFAQADDRLPVGRRTESSLLSMIRPPSSILLPTWTAIRYTEGMNTALKIVMAFALVVGLGCQDKAQGG